MKEDKNEHMENGVNVTIKVDTIREEMPPDLKKKLFPEEPEDSRQNMSTEKKKGPGKKS